MSNMAASNSLLGWTRFFNELDAFNRACEIQSGSANRAFTEYALERLQTGIRSVSSVLDNIKMPPPLMPQKPPFMKTILANFLICYHV